MGGPTGKRSDRAGPSPTSLARKLGIDEGDLLVLVDAPAGWKIASLPPGVRIVRRRGALRAGDERAAVVVAFVPSAARLERVGPELAASLPETASLWVAWPRRAGGHDSDVTDQRVREALLPTGWVDVKVAALDEDWSGLKFVVRLEHRSAGRGRPRSPRPVKTDGDGGR
jgi:hypothetical protein